MFETTNVMMGNDPIAENVIQMMNGLRELELIDILDMLLLQSTVSEVFTNWDPVKDYMENGLKLSPTTVEIVSKSDLDIPGVRNLHSGPENLKKSSPKKSSNQINQFHEKIFLTKIHFLQFQKWPKINF